LTKRLGRSWVLVLFVFSASLLAARAQERPAGSADDLASVRDVLRGLAAADNADNLDAVVSHYREDAMLLPPNAGAVAGRPAIRVWYEQGFHHFRFEVSFDVEEIQASGDWAFARGYINGQLNPKADEAPVRLHEKYLMVLRRDPGGWKIARLMWNSDEPRPAAPR